MTRLSLLAALSASVAAGGLLAGCGGDSTPPAPPPAASNELPASALASDSALEAFAIAQAPSETADPLLLDNVTTLPTSETEEPIAVK
jgi:hypothetical protein